MITTYAYARAGLVGNPSDGYFGKTISFIIRNFAARIRLWETPTFEIVANASDLAQFDSVKAFLREAKLMGYYGSMRLIKATIKRFHDYARENGHTLHDKNFTVDFHSDIPRLVGVSGSSAIITATMRALMEFYNVQIPLHLLPTIVLSVEMKELGITAGLQDRVIQAYEGIVYMDFERSLVESRGYGNYEPLKPPKMPPLFVAYDPARAEISDVPHRNLRELWNKGDPAVVGAMQHYRELTDRAKTALMSSDWKTLGECIDANYDQRTKIMNVAPENHRMVEVARKNGSPAHFCGSGGAICGLYQDGHQYQQLSDALAQIGCSVLRPLIFDIT